MAGRRSEIKLAFLNSDNGLIRLAVAAIQPYNKNVIAFVFDRTLDFLPMNPDGGTFGGYPMSNCAKNWMEFYVDRYQTR